MDENPYQVLGLSTFATDQEIRKRFRDLAFKHHPDRNPGHREEAELAFKRVKDAYDELREQRATGFSESTTRQNKKRKESTRTKTASYGPHHHYIHKIMEALLPIQVEIILLEQSAYMKRAPRLFDTLGFQILGLALLGSVGIAILFGDSWWKTLNRGKSFEDMMKERHLFHILRMQQQGTKDNS
eukprot:jgi/Galph1/3162/GphlegSOOS_G1872.1